jgi:hypothetical protein
MTTSERLRPRWRRFGRRPARVVAALAALVLGVVLLTGSGAVGYDTAAERPAGGQPSSRATTSAGNPPVASGLQRVGVIRISDLS